MIWTMNEGAGNKDEQMGKTAGASHPAMNDQDSKEGSDRIWQGLVSVAAFVLAGSRLATLSSVSGVDGLAFRFKLRRLFPTGRCFPGIFQAMSE